jgi:hypothetical protein
MKRKKILTETMRMNTTERMTMTMTIKMVSIEEENQEVGEGIEIKMMKNTKIMAILQIQN